MNIGFSFISEAEASRRRSYKAPTGIEKAHLTIDEATFQAEIFSFLLFDIQISYCLT